MHGEAPRGGPRRTHGAIKAKRAGEKAKYQRREGIAGKSPARPELPFPSTKTSLPVRTCAPRPSPRHLQTANRTALLTWSPLPGLG